MAHSDKVGQNPTKVYPLKINKNCITFCGKRLTRISIVQLIYTIALAIYNYLKLIFEASGALGSLWWGTIKSLQARRLFQDDFFHVYIPRSNCRTS